jgi:hypothetical protein
MHIMHIQKLKSALDLIQINNTEMELNALWQMIYLISKESK